MTDDNLQSNFWDIVGDPLKIEDLIVGQHVTQEMTRHGEVVYRARKRVETISIGDDGSRTVTFSDLRPGEPFIDSGIVIGGEMP